MNAQNPDTRLIHLLADLEEDAVLKLVEERLAVGHDPLKILEDCNEGMRLVGQRYERGEYYIAGLIMSGEIFREVVEIIQPLMVKKTDEKSSGLILVGTVSGDIHDIGKNMVGMLLSCYGFTVIDLGVDVPPAEFAAKAVELKPDIVGLSGLITASFEMMKKTISALRAEAGTHNLSFPILIGGGMIDEQVCRYVGADYWLKDAMAGVRLCQNLLADRS
ncbi:MAG: cobalamin B12-binding domain-containing protein [Chloroflexi bacterium]|nr:cobalamin B12-binding domain-containing protein [Chloroflexota bacterium]